jgi:hypothetical protein
MNGVEKKKPVGLRTIDWRHVVNVWRMDMPLDAFSMMAL